jgi:hypothetical protein
MANFTQSALVSQQTSLLAKRNKVDFSVHLPGGEFNLAEARQYLEFSELNNQGNGP